MVRDKIKRFRSRHPSGISRGFFREVEGLICKREYGRRVVKTLTSARSEPQQWVFILGCYNSGTTILQRTLAAHPLVSAPPFEGTELTQHFPDLESGNWPRLMYVNFDRWDCMSQQDDGAIVAELVKSDWSLWNTSKTTTFLEKSVAHVAHIKWIRRHFRNVKFIVLRRNGFCVNEGIIRRSASSFSDDASKLEKYSPRILAEQWKAINDRIDDHTLGLENVISVSYEEFSEDPEKTTVRVLQFLGLSSEVVSSGPDGTLMVANASFNIRNLNDESLRRVCKQSKAEMWSVFSEKMIEYGYDNPSE